MESNRPSTEKIISLMPSFFVIVIFSVEGRLDSITSLEFQDKLISAFNECEHVSLDFKDVSFISSAGLRVLVMAQKTAHGRKGSLTLLNVSEQIMKLLDMTGLSAHLSINPAER